MLYGFFNTYLNLAE